MSDVLELNMPAKAKATADWIEVKTLEEYKLFVDLGRYFEYSTDGLRHSLCPTINYNDKVMTNILKSGKLYAHTTKQVMLFCTMQRTHPVTHRKTIRFWTGNCLAEYNEMAKIQTFDKWLSPVNFFIYDPTTTDLLL